MDAMFKNIWVGSEEDVHLGGFGERRMNVIRTHWTKFSMN